MPDEGVGDRIRQAYEAAGFANQSEFADALGAPRQLLNAWVKGRKVPADESLEAIAAKTGRTVAWLRYGETAQVSRGTSISAMLAEAWLREGEAAKIRAEAALREAAAAEERARAMRIAEQGALARDETVRLLSTQAEDLAHMESQVLPSAERAGLIPPSGPRTAQRRPRKAAEGS